MAILRRTEIAMCGAKPRNGGSVVEHRAVMREVVSSTPAGPTLRVLK